MDELILERNGTDQLRVYQSEWKGKVNLQVRAWYRDGEEWKPGKGATLKPAEVKDVAQWLWTWAHENT